MGFSKSSIKRKVHSNTSLLPIGENSSYTRSTKQNTMTSFPGFTTYTVVYLNILSLIFHTALELFMSLFYFPKQIVNLL